MDWQNGIRRSEGRRKSRTINGKTATPNTDGHPHIPVLHGQDIPKEDVEEVGGTFATPIRMTPKARKEEKVIPIAVSLLMMELLLI